MSREKSTTSAVLIDEWALFYDNKLVMTFEKLEDAQQYAENQSETKWHDNGRGTYTFGGKVQTSIDKFKIQRVMRFHWRTPEEHEAYLQEY